MHSFLSIFCIILFSYICLLNDMIAPVHHGTTNTPGASVPLIMAREVRTLSQVRHPELIALYASAPNHDLGQWLGLPGSYVLVHYVPLYRLR